MSQIRFIALVQFVVWKSHRDIMGHLKIFNVNICRCAQQRAFPILARKYLDVTIRRPFGARAKVTGVRGRKNLPVALRASREARSGACPSGR
jgi:hypothetical protein